MAKRSIVSAGIDTGKRKLDVAIDGRKELIIQVENKSDGFATLVAWLRRHRVTRVGIEASGGYEQAIVAELRRCKFVVVVFQPAQVRAYAQFHLQRAKNDKIDAVLIAACTAAVKKIHDAPDPRLAPFAVHLTMIEQIGQDISCLKNRIETCRDQRIKQHWKDEIARLERQEKAELKALAAAIRKHADLGARLDLIESVDGIGLPTAVAVLVRLPEIGKLTREQAAALVGAAPYDDDSGDRNGARQIAGGRQRLRCALFRAALPASFHWNKPLVAFYQRLVKAGKSHKCALIACVRKLIIYANTVVARGTPWQKELEKDIPALTAG